MTTHPKARSAQLLVRRLDQETLVYDTKDYKATCLNSLATEVWGLCDGRHDPDEIARDCQSEDVDEETVAKTLGRLSAAGLLESPFKAPPNTTRRAVVGQLAGTFGLAMAVTSISVPAASQGASCLPNGNNCTADADCCSNHCHGNGKCTGAG